MPRTSDPTSGGAQGGWKTLRTTRGLVSTGLVLLALLGVVAAATRGHRGGGAGGTHSVGGPSNSFVSYAISTYLVVAVVMVALVLLLLFAQRDSLPARKGNRDLRSLLVFLFIIVVVALVSSLRHFHPRPAHPLHLPAGTHTDASPAKQAGRHALDTPPFAFKWAPLVVFAVLAAAAVAFYVIRRKRRPGFRRPLSLAEEVGQVLDLVLDDLRAERDPRRAIIAAYARMERLLGAHGLPRQPAEAPFEYLARVLQQLDASPTPVFELTTLFERAKFSDHAIGPDLKDEAIDALAAVRDELRAAA